MSKEYYNRLFLKKITDIKDQNPERSRVELENYLGLYPMDYYGWVLYISVLISLQEIEQAEKCFEILQYKMSKKDYSIYKHYFYERNFGEYLSYVNSKLLSYQENYEELYLFLNDNLSVIDSFKRVSYLKLFCEKKLGLLNYEKSSQNSYIVNQIIDYNEGDMKEHIKKHMSYYNAQEKISNSSVFCSDFPIDEALEVIKKFIPSSNKYLCGLYDDSYYFKYDYCGKIDGKSTNYFRVICFHNTEDVITVCPSTVDDTIKHVDLNYLKDDKVVVKRISQIDKFNRRYSR